MTVNGTPGPHFLNCSVLGSPLTSNLQPWYIAAGVVTGLSCLLGVPANFTIIVQLSRHLRGSSMTQRLFFNLAVSDLLCLIYLPFGVFIFYNEICLANGLYQFLFYFFIFCTTTSLNILVLISIQRYYQVLHPEKWAKVQRTWQRILLSSVWMLGALMAFPAIFMTQARNEQISGSSCSVQGIKPELEVFYISFVVFCYVALFSLYLLLVKGVKKRQMSDRKQPRATKIFIRIIAVYLVTGFLPLISRMYYVAALFSKSDTMLCTSKIMTFVECFYFFNHCMNPFLYFYASRRSKDSDRNNQLLNDYA
ncbi:type-1 angiotensin II receptor-like [Anabas testudineus]|uniref:G-protein coupled receptors family 1 profile domain-containing protein n=1 Tax=Anabas testudineus TaxID=64144 RepID=A0A3Q1IGK9_ANATE|nr:type-1 angiotensin II receptor-like [Anabas testudineus]